MMYSAKRARNSSTLNGSQLLLQQTLARRKLFELGKKQQLTLFFLLTLLLLATRSSHAVSLGTLPNASWAVFFIAGCYLRNGLWFMLFLGQALLIDLVAVTWGGVDNFCVSPAYGFLLPAYAALWYGGKWFATHCTLNRTAIPLLALSALIACLACEVLSSGGFYLFSGRFSPVTLPGFAQRFVAYFPSSLDNMLFYVSLAALIHASVLLATGKKSPATHDLRLM